MSHQGWLEKPYREAAERSEADERARELGYEDADDWQEAMYEEAMERRAEWQMEQELLGEEP